MAPAVDEVVAAITAVVAAVAEGAEMSDGALVPKEPAGGTTASSAGAATGAAGAAAAAVAAAAAKTWRLLRQLSCPCFAGALALDFSFLLFLTGLNLDMVELFRLICELLLYKLYKVRMHISLMWW